MTRQQSGGQAGEGSKAGEAGWWIRSRGQRSEQADGGWAVGRMVRQAGIRELAGSLVNQGLSHGKALWRTRDNLAGTDWEERTYIGGAQVKVVGLIRGAQGGRQVNGKTRGGP